MLERATKGQENEVLRSCQVQDNGNLESKSAVKGSSSSSKSCQETMKLRQSCWGRQKQVEGEEGRAARLRGSKRGEVELARLEARCSTCSARLEDRLFS